MIRNPLSLMALLLAFGPAAALLAQDQASLDRLEKSPRHHEWAEIDAGNGRKLKSFVVFPEVDGPRPVVIVIHENRGLQPWVRSVADQVAEAGYVAVAPDLLSHHGPNGGGTDAFASSDAAREGIYKLKADDVTADLKAVVAYAKKIPAGNGKIAVAGFCWGGGQSFRFAANCPDLAASFVFYGPAPEAADLARIGCPVYGFYGGNDFRISGQVPDVEAAMKKDGKKYEPVVYDKAGHGFMRSGEAADAPEADQKARTEGWERWKKLLGNL